MDSSGEKKCLLGPAELSMLGGLAFAAVLVAVSYLFDLRSRMVPVLEWIDSFGPWAAAVFMVVDMLAVVVLAPSLPLTMGAGFIFGVGWGTLYCLVARTIGSTLGFLIARYALGERVGRYIRSRQRFHLANAALAEDGGRIVFLTRLVPLFPGKLSNYLFGVTRCPLRGFFLGTFAGMIPFTFTNTYMGSLAGDLATIGMREGPRTPLQWALDGIGLLIALSGAIALAHYARTRLGRYTTNGSSD